MRTLRPVRHGQRSVGLIFYTWLILAEAFGKSGASRIIDLVANNGSVCTPAYAIWQKGVLSKLALFDYVTDPSPATVSDATFAIGGGTSRQPTGTPPTAKVKYLLSDSTTVLVRAAPGFALVFIADDPDNLANQNLARTHSTTAWTETFNTTTVDPSQLANSNGQSGEGWVHLGSTSYGSRNYATGSRGSVLGMFSVIAGCAVGLLALRAV